MPTGPTSDPIVRRVIRRTPTPAADYQAPRTPPPPVASNGHTPSDDDDGGPAIPRHSETVVEDSSSFITSGWGGARQLKKEMPSDFAQNFKVPTDWVVIKFLEEGPFANYRQHWADWLPSGSKLSYVCRKRDCPLCEVGDKGVARFCFNIVDLTDPANPINAVLAVGIKVANVLEEYHNDSKTSPINRADMYCQIKKTGTKQTTQTTVTPVKARDLVDDWGFEPLSDAELAVYSDRCYAPAAFASPSSRAELEAVAALIPG